MAQTSDVYCGEEVMRSNHQVWVVQSHEKTATCPPLPSLREGALVAAESVVKGGGKDYAVQTDEVPQDTVCRAGMA